MPRSKHDVTEELAGEEAAIAEVEAAEPENVAARALGHKAEEDVGNFLKGLQIAFMEMAKKELQVFLPHIQITKRERQGIQFTRGGYQAEDRAIIDLLLVSLSEYVDGIYNPLAEYEVKQRERFSGSPTKEYLFRERVRALAQELLKETGDDVAEGCGEGGS